MSFKNLINFNNLIHLVCGYVQKPPAASAASFKVDCTRAGLWKRAGQQMQSDYQLTLAPSSSVESRGTAVGSSVVDMIAEYELQKHEVSSDQAGVTVSAGQQRYCLLIFAKVLNLS